MASSRFRFLAVSFACLSFVSLFALSSTAVRGARVPGMLPFEWARGFQKQLPCGASNPPDIYYSGGGNGYTYGACPHWGFYAIPYYGPLLVDAASNLKILEQNQVLVFGPNETAPSQTIPLKSDETLLNFAQDKKGHFWAIATQSSPPDANAVSEFSPGGALILNKTCTALHGYGNIAVDDQDDVFVSTASAIVEWPAKSPTCIVLPPMLSNVMAIQMTREGDLAILQNRPCNGGIVTTYGHPGFSSVIATTTTPGFVCDATSMSLVRGDNSVYVTILDSDEQGYIGRYSYGGALRLHSTILYLGNALIPNYIAAAPCPKPNC